MKGLIVILTLALVASNITVVHGLAMEAIVAHMGSCKCWKQTSSAFSPKKIKSIQVIPHGIHCQRTEIILTLKNKRKICVLPNAPWVQEVLKKVTKRVETGGEQSSCTDQMTPDGLYSRQENV